MMSQQPGPGYVWRGDVLLHVPGYGPVHEVATVEDFPCLVRYRRYLGSQQMRVHGENPEPVKVEL